ncbi:uncharacterized protein LOC142232471 [Haematobia irritans]|uniref:uncharacterized protein LOC142232471 n=1 Tax=Haematobia irritans TaxID=7368 RepID=UPI003F5012A6
MFRIFSKWWQLHKPSSHNISMEMTSQNPMFKRPLLCQEINQDDSFNLEYRGPVVMKGKPTPMNCWFLTRNTTTTGSAGGSTSGAVDSPLPPPTPTIVNQATTFTTASNVQQQKQQQPPTPAVRTYASTSRKTSNTSIASEPSSSTSPSATSTVEAAVGTSTET